MVSGFAFYVPCPYSFGSNFVFIAMFLPSFILVIVHSVIILKVFTREIT